MRVNPRIFLGFLILVIFLILIVLWQNRKSVVTFRASENKFQINFDLTATDQKKLGQVLEKLSLPQSIKNGIEFQLDATASARLAFVLPLRASADIDPSTITFEGSLTRAPFSKDTQVQNFKIPASTNLAIFGSNFNNFLKTKFPQPKELGEWIDQNLSSENGQYLLVFGQKADLAVILRKTLVDLEGLKTMQVTEGQEPFYKEEWREDISFHLVNLPGNDQATTLTFFQTGQWFFLVSSYEAALELVKVQKSQSLAIDFPNLPGNAPATLIVFFRNPDQNPITEDFNNLQFSQQVKNTQILEKIESFRFILKGNRFSGLINIK